MVNKFCDRCEKRKSGYNRPNIEDKDCPCSCHTVSPTVEPTEKKGFVNGHYARFIPEPTVEVGWEEEFDNLPSTTITTKDFIKSLLSSQKERIIEEMGAEVERLRQVRILIPKNVGGNSKCITEGYHRCLDKIEQFIRKVGRGE